MKCCYDYKCYEECCYWSDYVGQKCSLNAEAKKLRDHFLLYKAKAKYQIYQRSNVILRRSEKLQNLGEMKQSRESLFEDTKEVISILGSLKARNFSFDLKCEQFLDYALMDYVRELNKRSSKDSLYCMLCHKKEPIVRSHTVPEAVLKIIFSEGHNLFVMGPSSQSLDSQVKTLHTVTYNMLCNLCDNEVLSRDENSFIENIAKPLYQSSPTSHLEMLEIPYDKLLYRFCAGIIFRNLALTRGVTGLVNADDIHELFHYCRSVVSQSSEFERDFRLPACEHKFPIGLFFTPGKEDQKEKPSNIVGTLNSNIFVILSSISAVSNTSYILSRKCFFFAVHFGIFTVVAFLESVPPKYHNFLVKPSGGKLNVPSNSNRLCLIPPGLLQVFEEHNQKSMKQYLEKLVEVNPEMKSISLTVLKSNVPGSLLRGEPTSFCLLPPKFELNRQTNALSMKEGHSILLHCTLQSNSTCHTVFLAVEDAIPEKPYVILHSYCDTPTMSQTFGYYVTLPEFAYMADLDASHSMLMRNIRAKDLDLFRLPCKVIPTMMKAVGLQNYQSILYHISRLALLHAGILILSHNSTPVGWVLITLCMQIMTVSCCEDFKSEDEWLSLKLCSKQS